MSFHSLRRRRRRFPKRSASPSECQRALPSSQVQAIRNSDALYWWEMTTPHGESPAGIVLTTLFVAASMIAMSFDGPFAV